MKFAARHAADRHRKRSRSRARRRRLLAGCALLSALLAVVYLSVGTVPGSDFANAAIQRAKSLVELIQQRSPGRRTHAQLTKLRHVAAARPHERALPKIRWAAPPILFPQQQPALIDLVSAPPVHVAGLESFTPPPLIEQSPFQPPPVFTPPTILIPPVEIPKEVPPVVPPPSPVPEPGTWASMLLGFGLMGWTLRRRRTQVSGEAC